MFTRSIARGLRRMATRVPPQASVKVAALATPAHARAPVAACRAFSVATSRAHQAEAGAGAEEGGVVYEVQQVEFQKKVMESTVPVVLDCYAE